MTLLLLLNQPTYHLDLLNAAERFLNENHPAVALITAHMAGEIYAERVMTAAFTLRGSADLAKSVMRLASVRDAIPSQRSRDEAGSYVPKFGGATNPPVTSAIFVAMSIGVASSSYGPMI